LQRALTASLNRLTKWRGVFASWQLGTRTKEDPECQAVRDHREATIMLRAELSAVTFLLIEKKVFTDEEYDAALLGAADRLDAEYQKGFPGFKSSDTGMVINAAIAKDTMAGWRP
jgi:hypothetical protein